MDGRKNNGGHSTAGFAGRKPKDSEQKLIEKLSPYDETAIMKLFEAIDEGKDWAIKLFFNYRFGMPNSKTDITSNGESIKSISVDIVRSED